ADLAAADPAAVAPAATGESALRLLSPAGGSRYRFSASLSAGAQAIRLEAAGPAGLQQVRFIVDGRPVGVVAAGPYALMWALQPGSHRIWAEAQLADGSWISSPAVQIEVLRSGL
ncbi:MAG: Ig-like domain-containing protein, partial [Chloroflexota bacterium]